MSRLRKLAIGAARFLLLAAARPAFSMGCAIAVLLVFDLIVLSWWWVAGLTTYPVIAFLLVGVIDTFFRPASTTEPGGVPGTESQE